MSILAGLYWYLLKGAIRYVGFSFVESENVEIYKNIENSLLTTPLMKHWHFTKLKIEKGQSDSAESSNFIGFIILVAFPLKTLPRFDPALFLAKRPGGGGRGRINPPPWEGTKKKEARSRGSKKEEARCSNKKQQEERSRCSAVRSSALPGVSHALRPEASANCIHQP